jgi:hypothetical protein
MLSSIPFRKCFRAGTSNLQRQRLRNAVDQSRVSLTGAQLIVDGALAQARMRH